MVPAARSFVVRGFETPALPMMSEGEMADIAISVVDVVLGNRSMALFLSLLLFLCIGSGSVPKIRVAAKQRRSTKYKAQIINQP
jgi:hypothetical protein